MKIGTICYVEKDNHYLMLHRNKKPNDMHKNLWVGLGGKIEPGESPEECVIREVYEESGLRIINPQLRGILTFPADGIEDDWYVFLFTATNFTGQIKLCDEGELAWVETSKVKDLPMHEGDKYFIRYMQEHDGVFTIKFNYDHGNFKGCDVLTY